METKPTISQTAFAITAAVVMSMAAIGSVLQDMPAFSGAVSRISAFTIHAEVIIFFYALLAGLFGGIALLIYRFARR